MVADTSFKPETKTSNGFLSDCLPNCSHGLVPILDNDTFRRIRKTLLPTQIHFRQSRLFLNIYSEKWFSCIRLLRASLPVYLRCFSNLNAILQMLRIADVAVNSRKPYMVTLKIKNLELFNLSTESPSLTTSNPRIFSLNK